MMMSTYKNTPNTPKEQENIMTTVTQISNRQAKSDENRGDMQYDEMTENGTRKDFSVNNRIRIIERRIARYEQFILDNQACPRRQNYAESQIIDLTREREYIIADRYQNMNELLRRMQTRTGMKQTLATRWLWTEIQELSEWVFAQ